MSAIELDGRAMNQLTEQVLRQVLDAAPEAIIVVNASGSIIFANTQVTTLFGYESDQLIDQPLEVLIPQSYRHKHTANRQAYFKTPIVRPMGQGLKLFGQRQDGTEFPIEISLSPVKAEQEICVVAAIHDVTPHRDIEERLTGIFETSLNEIYVFDAYKLHFIQVNEGARKNLGYSMEELLNLTPVDIKPEYTNEQFKELIRPLRDKPKSKIQFETVHLRKDGTTYPVEVHMQSSLHESTPVFTAIVLDISERMEAEEELRESHKNLEKRVIQRTLQLEEARKEAEQASVGKSRFLAAASHDLRQPLQSVGLYLSVMNKLFDTEKLAQPEKCFEVSGKMRSSLDNMSQLLDALLDISKLDSGSITPVKRDIHTRDLFDDICTASIQQAKEKGLTLECTGDDCLVYSDPALLGRIVENFVTNAIRYTEKGQVTIHCECHDQIARISVADTGIGIPADSLSDVFEEYYQLDNPSRDRRKGLGLGLSIAKYVAKLLDHRITATSVLGDGSIFTVEVPLAQTKDITMSARESAENEEKVDRHLPSVLLVDDDPGVVDATSMLLQLTGVQVFCASNGDQALDHISSGMCPGLLISDYRLPGYNGVELVRRVRKLTSEDLPVILITGDTSGSEIEAAKLEHCTVLHKPVDTDQLISLINNIDSVGS